MTELSSEGTVHVRWSLWPNGIESTEFKICHPCSSHIVP
jgi:hypothetical protein